MTDRGESLPIEKQETALLENLKSIKQLFVETSPVIDDAQISSEKIFESIRDVLLHDDSLKNGWSAPKSITVVDNENAGIAIAFRKSLEGTVQLWVGLASTPNEKGAPIKKNHDYFIVLQILITQAGLHRHQNDHPSIGPVADIEYAFYEHFKELKPTTVQWLRDWAMRNPDGIIELAPMIEEMTSDY